MSDINEIRRIRAAGEWYRPDGSAELTAEYMRAADLVARFNSISFTQMAERRAILSDLLGTMGENCRILSPFHCDFGYNIHVGDNFFANTGLVILDEADVRIGNNVLIAPQVGIYTAYHPFDYDMRIAGYEAAKPITIGDGVWIGGHASILPGVTIGKGSVIGAGSVVNRDITEGVVAAGNPCRIIRKLSEQE